MVIFVFGVMGLFGVCTSMGFKICAVEQGGLWYYFAVRCIRNLCL